MVVRLNYFVLALNNLLESFNRFEQSHLLYLKKSWCEFYEKCHGNSFMLRCLNFLFAYFSSPWKHTRFFNFSAFRINSVIYFHSLFHVVKYKCICLNPDFAGTCSFKATAIESVTCKEDSYKKVSLLSELWFLPSGRHNNDRINFLGFLRFYSCQWLQK